MMIILHFQMLIERLRIVMKLYDMTQELAFLVYELDEMITVSDANGDKKSNEF